jgi:hypothetical protein
MCADRTDGGFALIRSPNPRSIGIVVPDVVVNEIGNDELVITRFPVERGAAVSDHAWKQGAEIEMRCGWSDSTHRRTGFVREVQALLLAIQIQREPITVTAGKRIYRNMLIQGITQVDDVDTEFSLRLSVVMKEVLITSSSAKGAKETQSLPQETSSLSNTGNPNPTITSGETPLPPPRPAGIS